MNAAGWAALWFADIEILRSCAQCDTMQNWIFAELFSTENKSFPRLLLDCMLLLMEALAYEFADKLLQGGACPYLKK